MGKREQARRVFRRPLVIMLLLALAVSLLLAATASALPTFTAPPNPQTTPATPACGTAGCHFSNGPFGTTPGLHALTTHSQTSCSVCHTVSTSIPPSPGQCIGCHNPISHVVTEPTHSTLGCQSQGCHPPAAPAATITSLAPNHGTAGASVTITGTGFGSTQGTGSVRFGTTTATVTSWSDTSIVAVVPSGLAAVQVQVTVTPNGGTASNAMAFAVELQITKIKVVLGGVKNGVIKVNKTVTVKGTVTPARAGKATVSFQLKANGKWVKKRTVTTSINATSGAFTTKYKVTKKGSWRVVCAVGKTTTATADQVRKTFKVK